MKNEYLTLEQLQVGKSYWVVNGHWEFKVVEVTDRYIDIYIPYLRQKQLILRSQKLSLQLKEIQK